MNLWAWAVAAWEKPGVEPAALKLQDEAGQSVALLLWVAWCMAESRTIARPVLRHAVTLARSVETEVLRPLRATRRALGERPEASVWIEARAAVRAAELAVERALLKTLEGIASPSLTPRVADSASELAKAMEAWNGAPLNGEDRAGAAGLAAALAGELRGVQALL